MDDDGRAVLVLDGLDPAPQGKTYELWIIEGENASPAGLFPGQDGRDWSVVDGTVESGDVVAVTVEEAGRRRGLRRTIRSSPPRPRSTFT